MILVAYLETGRCGCDVEYETHLFKGSLLVRCPRCNFSEVDRNKNRAQPISALAPIARTQVLHGKIDFSIYCAKE